MKRLKALLEEPRSASEEEVEAEIDRLGLPPGTATVLQAAKS